MKTDLTRLGAAKLERFLESCRLEFWVKMTKRKNGVRWLFGCSEILESSTHHVEGFCGSRLFLVLALSVCGLSLRMVKPKCEMSCKFSCLFPKSKNTKFRLALCGKAFPPDEYNKSQEDGVFCGSFLFRPLHQKSYSSQSF